MTDARMLIIVPTRSRPENVAKVVRAWEDTDAFAHAALYFVVDRDDSKWPEYEQTLSHQPGNVQWLRLASWMPLVPKLNIATMSALDLYKTAPNFAIGFAGDDHLPRTHRWAARYLEKLIEMGTGVVSCPDGYRTDRLPTQWAMTANIVRALGRMVPAPVDHLYCDNAVQDLAEAAGCYAYLDDVLIEHMHPVAGKAENDDQYRRVNAVSQFKQDRAAYQAWRSDGCGRDSETVRGLITGA